MDATEETIAAVRGFNRFYTARLGLLEEGLHASPFGLTEARVLYELAHREAPTAAGLARDLALDTGYLSRILKRFAQRGLIVRRASATDGRQSHIELTAAGREAFAPLDAASRGQAARLLEPLDPGGRRRLAGALADVQRLLGDVQASAPFVLRPHRAGDMGWIAERHAALYASEHGFDRRFEALVLKIAAEFLERFDPSGEACWIAERDGTRLGSVVLVRLSAEVAKLRLLLVEPEARGHGLGELLVATAEDFARSAGYRRITLWTNDILLPARRLYERRGYVLTAYEPHAMFGPAMVGETWELALDGGAT